MFEQIIKEYFPGAQKEYIGGSDGDPGDDMWMYQGLANAAGPVGVESIASVFDQMANSPLGNQPGMNISPERRMEIMNQWAQQYTSNPSSVGSIQQYLNPQENQAFQSWNNYVNEANSSKSLGDYMAMGTFGAGLAGMGALAFGGLGAGAAGDAAWGVNPATPAYGELGSGSYMAAENLANATSMLSPTGGTLGSGLAGTAGAGLGLGAPTGGFSLSSLLPNGSGSLLPSAANLVGGGIQALTAGRAADSQQQATNAAIGETGRQYDINRNDLAPWRQSGGAAVNRLSSLMGLVPNDTAPDAGSLNNKFTLADFWDDPVTKASYQSGLDQGTQALDRMAGARGNRNSGAQLKALNRFATDYTGNQAGQSQARFIGDQNNTYNRLAGIAGTGQQAVNTTAANGTASSNNIASLLSSQGNARGAAQIAQGNAIGGAFNQISNNYNSQNTLDKILAAQKNRPYYGGY